MFIKAISLQNYRNYSSLNLDFDPKTNIFYGDNAQGKTNILEAVYVSGTTRSHKNAKDRELILFGEEEAHICTLLEKRGLEHKIDIHLRKNRTKGIAIDGVPIRKASELYTILDTIRELFPECERVTSYASPSSIRLRTDEELQTLRAKGLTMVYMGLESGSDKVLTLMRKGHPAAEIIEMGQKVRRNGMALSVTAITGLGGPELLEEHAVKTAEAFNAMNPEYIGMLTLMVEPGTPLYDWVHDGSFRLLDQHQVLKETELLVSHFDSPGSVFRMNHASNYLDLRGTLNQDRDALLAKIHQAEQDLSCLRPESWRGL